MSTEAGTTSGPITQLHPTLASAATPMHDAPAPIEITADEGDRYTIDDLLETAEACVHDANDALEQNEAAIADAAGDPSRFLPPLQIAALERAIVSLSASQVVVARALLDLVGRIDSIGVGAVRPLNGIDEKLEEFLELLRASR